MHDVDLHAAILAAPCRRGVGRHGPRLAHAPSHQSLGGDATLDQRLAHCLGTLRREREVGRVGPGVVGVPFDEGRQLRVLDEERRDAIEAGELLSTQLRGAEWKAKDFFRKTQSHTALGSFASQGNDAVAEVPQLRGRGFLGSELML